MERARPHELRDHAVPILTARITEAELAEWFPIQFDEISDPLEAPEPSRGALVKLRNGSYAVLTYGKDSGHLTVELPESTRDRTAFLEAFFKEVPLPASRVLWHRADTHLPKISRSDSDRRRETTLAKKTIVKPKTSRQRTKRSALRASLPKKAK
jgi:hypothetical protein